jgi:hypothetical protein
MAVRNTKTGGARKRVAGETKKGGKTTKQVTKPAVKTVPAKKPMPNPYGVENTSRPNMHQQYKEPKVDAPKTPVAKPPVKKPVLTKKNPGNMNQQQISRKANYGKGTGSK